MGRFNIAYFLYKEEVIEVAEAENVDETQSH